jgi:hypothetical protein
MTNNVIDFHTRKPVASAPQGPIVDTDPFLTLELRRDSDGGMPTRVVADLRTPAKFREAAEHLITAALTLYNAAYEQDTDTEQLPRMLALLFHSGRIAVRCLNPTSDDGNPTPADFDFMRGAVPYIGATLTQIQHAARRGES